MKYMIEFIISLIPASLFIYGFNILFQEGHLLEKPGQWLRTNWPEWLTKPLFDCSICMASLWGTYWFFLLDHIFLVNHPWVMYIPYIFGLCGLNTIINKLTSKERVIVDED